MNIIHSTVLALLLVASSLNAQAADNSIKDFGDYQVHYSVLNSTFIQPKIARNYGLQRGTDIGLVNIAVFKKSGENSMAVKAKLTGKTANLIQQQEPLDFQAIEEGSAIYYISSFKFSSQEVLHFTVEIEAADSSTMTLKFTHSLYEE